MNKFSEMANKNDIEKIEYLQLYSLLYAIKKANIPDEYLSFLLFYSNRVCIFKAHDKWYIRLCANSKMLCQHVFASCDEACKQAIEILADKNYVDSTKLFYHQMLAKLKNDTILQNKIINKIKVCQENKDISLF